jgi:hypothetical protein
LVLPVIKYQLKIAFRTLLKQSLVRLPRACSKPLPPPPLPRLKTIGGPYAERGKTQVTTALTPLRTVPITLP